jgi:hypothetical protein
MQRARLAAIASLTLAMTLALSACMTPGTARYAAYEERNNADYDSGKVDAVTQWSHMKGATVVWVNYPTKPKDRD